MVIRTNTERLDPTQRHECNYVRGKLPIQLPHEPPDLPRLEVPRSVIRGEAIRI